MGGSAVFVRLYSWNKDATHVLRKGEDAVTQRCDVRGDPVVIAQ